MNRDAENGKPAGVTLTPAEFIEFLSRFEQLSAKLSQALLLLAKQGQEIRDMKDLLAKMSTAGNLTEPSTAQAQHCADDVRA